jgi:hypothetical protein
MEHRIVVVESRGRIRRYPVTHGGYEAPGGQQAPTDADFIHEGRRCFREDGASEANLATATYRVEKP